MQVSLGTVSNRKERTGCCMILKFVTALTVDEDMINNYCSGKAGFRCIHQEEKKHSSVVFAS